MCRNAAIAFGRHDGFTVRPQLEYASEVWDPHQIGDIVELEKVQQRAAHWVMNDYGNLSFVTLMLNQLSWPTLHKFS